jgi:hypothetical protein
MMARMWLWSFLSVCLSSGVLGLVVLWWWNLEHRARQRNISALWARMGLGVCLSLWLASIGGFLMFLDSC